MIDLTLYAYLGGAWVDITSDALSNGISGTVGISGDSPVDRIAGEGTLSFTLKNNSENYTPGSGTAHVDWKKGTPVKVVFSNFLTKVKFIGRVEKIKLNYAYNNDTASVTAKDWMYYASKLPLDIPALQENKRADEIITTILGVSPIQPEGTDLQSGYTTFPYAFHDNTVKTTAYSEISKAVLSEWGMGYVKQDGTLVFEAHNGRTSEPKELSLYTEQGGVLLFEDGTEFLFEDGTQFLLEDYSLETQPAEISNPNGTHSEYGENTINRVSLQVYPYKLSDYDKLVYTNETNQLIPPGQTISFQIPFIDQESKLPLAAVLPSVKQTTLIHFDTQPDGVTGLLEELDQTIPLYPSSFSFASGATISTGQKKFGTASLLLNGSSDYVYSEISQEKFNPRDEDFTVDWWEYRLSSTAGKTAIARGSSGFAPYVFGYSDGTNLRCYITSNGVSWDIANAKNFGTISASTWTHYAITRSGNTFRTFKNGVQQDTWTSSASIYATSDIFVIGVYSAGYYNGYIDEFRMIKGYAEYTADFTPATSAHKMSGINWRVYTLPARNGTDITESMTATASPGGTGMFFDVTSSSASNGYLVLDVYATPLQSLASLSHIAEDTASINEYGYLSQNIEMRLRDDINFAKTIAEDVVATEKDPRTILKRISFDTGKSIVNENIFMQCDLGDLISISDPLSGYSGRNHINSISWTATPISNGVKVAVDYKIKEQ